MESWLFLGNPGVGKSTLLNCLAGRAVFPSGVSYGGGLTMDMQTCADYQRAVVYTDTPGLADRTAERKAADAITRALRSSGPRVKLCFVVHLQYGRVVSQDLATIERVLDSIQVPNVPFGIVINGVDAAVCRTLASDAGAFKRLVALLNSGKYTTPHVLVIPEIEALVDQDDCVVELPLGVRSTLEQFPSTSLPMESVVAISVDDFSGAVNRIARSVSALERTSSCSTARSSSSNASGPTFGPLRASR